MRGTTKLLVVLSVLALAFVAFVPAVSAAESVTTRTMDMPEELGLVDPATGMWHLAGRSAFFYGNPSDVPFMGDWDGDGVDTPGLYRPSDGFVYLRDSNSQGIADVEFYFGDPGDVPLAGDFDGDGTDSVSLYRPDESRFYVINRLGSGAAGLGAADSVFTFGNVGDVPFAGDFDGNGIDDVAVFRPATGLIYERTQLSAGPASVTFRAAAPGDLIVAGDWNGPWDCWEFDCMGDGVLIDTVACYRPSDATFHVAASNTTGPLHEVASWGESDWLPVSGRFVRHPVDEVVQAILGTWVGTIVSPLDGTPYGASIQFNADGTYAVPGPGAPLFEFELLLGTVGFPVERTYRIYGADGTGGYGELVAVATPTRRYAPIENIEVDGDTLTMIFRWRGLGWPLELMRVS